MEELKEKILIYLEKNIKRYQKLPPEVKIQKTKHGY